MHIEIYTVTMEVKTENGMCLWATNVRGMVKNLPLLQGARRSLFSQAGIAAPASRRSYSILT